MTREEEVCPQAGPTGIPDDSDQFRPFSSSSGYPGDANAKAEKITPQADKYRQEWPDSLPWFRPVLTYREHCLPELSSSLKRADYKPKQEYGQQDALHPTRNTIRHVRTELDHDPPPWQYAPRQPWSSQQKVLCTSRTLSGRSIDSRGIKFQLVKVPYHSGIGTNTLS